MKIQCTNCNRINDERFLDRAEIIWEKGTNRASFFRGEVNKYGWVDTGSYFLPSEIMGYDWGATEILARLIALACNSRASFETSSAEALSFIFLLSDSTCVKNSALLFNSGI